MMDVKESKEAENSEPFNVVKAEFKTDEWLTVRIEIVGDEMLAQIGEKISMGRYPMLREEKSKSGFVVRSEDNAYCTFRNLRIWEATPKEGWEKERSKLKRRL